MSAEEVSARGAGAAFTAVLALVAAGHAANVRALVARFDAACAPPK